MRTYSFSNAEKRKWLAGVVWMTVFSITILIAMTTTPAVYGNGQASKKTAAKSAGSTLKIIKGGLFKQGSFYLVKGSIYNPNAKAVKNVIIRYYVWKKFFGHDDRGSIVKQGGGVVIARINYLPPKHSGIYNRRWRSAIRCCGTRPFESRDHGGMGSVIHPV
ncbi:MAG TPA: hypothetical protein VGJ33_10820 [Candidatus Angelobacter sp.]|jgi:hypothetical protein